MRILFSPILTHTVALIKVVIYIILQYITYTDYHEKYSDNNVIYYTSCLVASILYSCSIEMGPSGRSL